MARSVHTEPSGKGEKSHGKKHLNASLPQQLVFDFNAVAKRHGHGRRDALVEDLIRRFLEKVEPDALSLRQPPSSPFVGVENIADFTSKQVQKIRQQLEEREAIRLSRELAEQIIVVTSSFTTRKPPKPSTSRQTKPYKASRGIKGGNRT